MPTLDQLTMGLLGAGFASRAAVPGLPPLVRIGYGLIGVELLRRAARGESHDMFGLRGSNVGRALPATSTTFEKRRARTIDERVGYVTEQVLAGERDPRVYVLARQVVGKRCGDDWCIGERDHRGEVEAIFAEVRRRCRYTLDPLAFDAFQRPGKTLELHTGDCDDGSSLLGAMLRSIGLPVKMRIVHTRGFPTWNHIYLTVTLPDGKEIPLDASVNKPPGWEVPSGIVLAKKDIPVNG